MVNVPGTSTSFGLSEDDEPLTGPKLCNLDFWGPSLRNVFGNLNECLFNLVDPEVSTVGSPGKLEQRRDEMLLIRLVALQLTTLLGCRVST